MAKRINTNVIVDSRLLLLSHKYAILKNIIIDTYSEPCQTSKMEGFGKLKVTYNLLSAFTLAKIKLHQCISSRVLCSFLGAPVSYHF